MRVVEGDRVVVGCALHGAVESRVTWYKDGALLNIEDERLVGKMGDEW